MILAIIVTLEDPNIPPWGAGPLLVFFFFFRARIKKIRYFFTCPNGKLDGVESYSLIHVYLGPAFTYAVVADFSMEEMAPWRKK